MKPLILIALAFGQLALADEAADRAAINKLIATLTDRNVSHDQLYTSDSGDSRAQLEQIIDARREPMSEVPPMSEVSPPLFVLNAVRFITPDVALADAASVRYGSLYNRRIPVLLILRKTKDWQIAVVRVQPNPVPFPGIGLNLVDFKAVR